MATKSHKKSKSFKKISSFDINYTGGPLQYYDSNNLILPKNGGLNILNPENGESKALLENDQADQNDFDIVTSFLVNVRIESGEKEIIVACRSGLVKIFEEKEVELGEKEEEKDNLINDVEADSQSENQIKTFRLKKQFRGLHRLPITCLETDSTGYLLATGSADGSVRVWDIIGNFCTNSYPISNDKKISCLEFNVVDENVVHLYFVGEMNVDLKLVNLSDKNSKPIIRKQAHSSEIIVLKYIKSMKNLISIGRDCIISVWSPDLSEKLKNVTLLEPISAGFICEDSLTAYCVADQNHLHRFDLKTYRHEKCLLSHHNNSYLGFEEKTNNLVISDYQNDLYFYDTNFIDPDSSQKDIFSRIPKIPQNYFAKTKFFPGHLDEVLALRFISNNLIAIASISEKLSIVDLETGQWETLLGHDESILSLSSFSDGTLVSGSKDKNIIIWWKKSDEDQESDDVKVENDQEEGEEAAKIQTNLKNLQSWHSVKIAGHAGAVTALACSRHSKKSLRGTNYRYLLSGSDDNTIKYWEFDLVTKNYKSLWTISAHKSDINDLDFSPNNAFLISASAEKNMKLFDIQDGSNLQTFKGHKKGLWSCTFSPTEQIVASCASDSTIKLWELESGQCIHTFEGHEASVLKLTFSPNGHHLISTDSQGIIKIWHIKTRECVNTIEGHIDDLTNESARIWALSQSHDGTKLITGGNDSRINIWLDDTENLKNESQDLLEKKIEQQQILENSLYNGELEKAFRMALRLDRPGKLYLVIEKIADAANSSMADFHQKMKPIISNLSTTLLDRLLSYTASWNSHSKMCINAQKVLNLIFACHKLEILSTLPSIESHLTSLISYTERHANRVENMAQKSTFIDFISRTADVYGLMDSESLNEDDGTTMITNERNVDHTHMMVDDSESDSSDVVQISTKVFSDPKKENNNSKLLDNEDQLRRKDVFSRFKALHEFNQQSNASRNKNGKVPEKKVTRSRRLMKGGSRK